MKPTPWFAIALAFVLMNTGFLAIAQSGASKRASAPQRGMSHQINQPAPESDSRRKLSESRIEEIKKLYLDAKKELESKNKGKRPDDKKPW